MTNKYPRKYITLPKLLKASEKERLEALYEAHEEINRLKSQVRALDKSMIKMIGEINYRLKHI